MYDEILVPTDGSDSAEQAARHAVVLARVYDARIHVLSVVDERDYDDDLVGDESVVRAGRDAAEPEAQAVVDAVADLASDVAVTTDIVAGVPADAILERVSAVGIDLVVMGTHGRTGVERFVIGSVAERVVRRADVPVVTVRADDDPPTWPTYDRLLLPTDGSDAATVAVPYALDLAERVDAALEVIYVLDERTKSRFYNVGTALEDLVGGLEATGKRATSRIEADATARGVDVSTTIVEGLPSKAICSHAEETGSDLVVMSSHGRTGLSHYLLGSVAERVVRNSTVPVLTAAAPR